MIARVRMSLPCPRIVARVRALLPMSTRRCLCLQVLPVVHTSFPVSVHVRGWSFSFVGMGGSLRSWAVRLRSWAMAGCGGGEPLVGGGESSGLA